jgi:hypothetical protein
MSAIDLVEPGLPLPKPKLSNAEKQRRYREKTSRRHEVGTSEADETSRRREVGAAEVTRQVTESNAGNAPVTPESNAGNAGNGNESNAESNAVTKSNADDGAMILCPRQAEVTAGFNESGDLILTQTNWPDDDSVIVISAGNVWDFLDRITDICGVPSSMP